MKPKKFDGVVEAVRYAPDGKVELVRVYERRGAAFSDRVLLTRQEFIKRLKTRKRFYGGRRVQFMAGTFELDQPVTVQGKPGDEVIVNSSADKHSTQDTLAGIPLF